MTPSEAGKEPSSPAREAVACSRVDAMLDAPPLAALVGQFLKGGEEHIPADPDVSNALDLQSDDFDLLWLETPLAGVQRCGQPSKHLALYGGAPQFPLRHSCDLSYVHPSVVLRR